MYVVYSMADFFRLLILKERERVMINPMSMMKMMQAKNKFTENSFIVKLKARF